MKSSKRTVWSVATVAVWIGLNIPAYALNGDLQGLNRRDATNWNSASRWIGNNLRGWRELDSVPCRVMLQGPATNSPVSIVFPHTRNGLPGFEDLFFISNSPNAVITQTPILVMSPDAEERSYDLAVSITGAEPAYLYFYARLAAGANLNSGSSLHIWGEPNLSPLQFHKVRPAKVKPDLAVGASGPAAARPGETLTYTINCTNLALVTNDTAHSIVVTAELPAFLDYVAGSATASGSVAGRTITWNFPELRNQERGSLSYQVVVSYSVPAGEVLTTMASINGAESDLDLSNNSSKALTSVVAASPTNSGAPTITRIVKFDEHLYHVFFLTRSDRNYVMQYTADFVEWATDPLIIPGTGGEVVSRQYEGGAKRFYRVMELP